jgi:sigma-B regulation protein RsbU (phosphoserine phosphatase)
VNVSAARSGAGSHDADAEHLRSKVNALASLIEISIIINSVLELDELVGLVMEKAQSVMNAEASSVMLINAEEQILECSVALGSVGDEVKKIRLKMGEGIAGWVAEHGESLLVPDVAADPRFSSKSDDSTGFQTRSILAAPLIVKDRTIGVAEVINRNDGLAFNDDDLELFSTFCRQVAMAIENARMYEVKLQQQRLENELESARIIQQSFMPEVFPAPPETAFSIAARSIPAKAVGGDFFDYIQFDRNTVGIALGDVTGKGVPAALYMARFVSDFRQYTKVYDDPAEALKELNRLLVDRSRRGMFVTFQYGILFGDENKFVLANGGHLPFIKMNNAERKIELLDGGKSIPLGIMPELAMDSDSVTIKRKDTLVLITDGIMEAKNKQSELYSLPRTLDVLSNLFDASADEIVRVLIEDVVEFSKGCEQHDDLTVLVMKWD